MKKKKKKNGLNGLATFLFVILTIAPLSSAQTETAAPSEIHLIRNRFTIVIAENEAEPVLLAIEALREDFDLRMGFKPEVETGLPANGSRPHLVIINRSNPACAAIEPPRQSLDGFESHRVYADPSAQRIYLEGCDLRGTIFAIYSFSEHILGTPPLRHWCSWKPAVTADIPVAGNTDLFFRSPQVRFRAILPGDTDFFSPWRERSPANDGIWLETVLRLKMNMVEGYSTISSNYEVSEYARLISKYGLALTSHHTSGLNTSFSRWKPYWREMSDMPPPALCVSNETQLREFFEYNAETVKRSGIENLWTLAFRGAKDEPFWNIFKDAPTSEPDRAAVINKMLQLQLDTIKAVTGETEPHVRITFYDEIADLMAKGLLRPPVSSNMIWTYVAARRDPYPYNDLVSHNPDAGVKLGYYMNFGFASTGPHMAPAEGPWKMEFNYRYVNGKSPLNFSVVNVGCFREFIMELSANARLLWDMSAYNTDRFLLDYCTQYFGAAHAREIAQLYRDYYQAYWQPKPTEFPGMERQFLFQDLRYARAFDQIAKQFFKTSGKPDMNPLSDIGFEREPGRTFRIDLAANQATSQIEALLNGMQQTIPKFSDVAARCTLIMPEIDAGQRTFFNDNLRVYSLYMEHLSRSLYHYTLAYSLQENRTELTGNLRKSYDELVKAQKALFETQHGSFSKWYSGAESMQRTFEIEKFKTTLKQLLKTAKSQK
ncbi:MAG: glycosyl hydrolase 115 family protein [Pontiellaceae bacterium]|nr:glycosyl hydrolase 115 family protein [Pontiellaceae bacterium]